MVIHWKLWFVFISFLALRSHSGVLKSLSFAVDSLPPGLLGAYLFYMEHHYHDSMWPLLFLNVIFLQFSWSLNNGHDVPIIYPNRKFSLYTLYLHCIKITSLSPQMITNSTKLGVCVCHQLPHPLPGTTEISICFLNNCLKFSNFLVTKISKFKNIPMYFL